MKLLPGPDTLFIQLVGQLTLNESPLPPCE
jgi:hypothetical protein